MGEASTRPQPAPAGTTASRTCARARALGGGFAGAKRARRWHPYHRQGSARRSRTAADGTEGGRRDRAPAPALRLLVVDDHEVVRQGLVALLDRRDGLRGRGRGRHRGRGDRARPRRFEPDVVIMDVRLPDGSGIEACREIRAERPETRVVMLTSYPDEEAVLSAIVAGATGYLLKQVRARDLVAAIEAVGRGDSLLDPAVTEKVLQRVRRSPAATYTDELADLTPAGAQDPAAGRRGQDQQGDRRRGLPVGQDGQELRQHHPVEAQPPASDPGSRLRRQAPDPRFRLKARVAPCCRPPMDRPAWSRRVLHRPPRRAPRTPPAPRARRTRRADRFTDAFLVLTAIFGVWAVVLFVATLLAIARPAFLYSDPKNFLKAAGSTVVGLLAISQTVTMYAAMGTIPHGNVRIGTLTRAHRYGGRIAILLAVAVAYFCLTDRGAATSPFPRAAIHAFFGSTAFAALAIKFGADPVPARDRVRRGAVARTLRRRRVHRDLADVGLRLLHRDALTRSGAVGAAGRACRARPRRRGNDEVDAGRPHRHPPSRMLAIRALNREGRTARFGCQTT